MKILVLTSYYPNPGHPISGIFNERCASALKELCDSVEVVCPRPYVPPLMAALSRRWKSYSAIRPYELRKGVPVHRPASLVVPRLGGAFWLDLGAYSACRRKIREIHRNTQLDAIISFDLLGAGGLAWRAGRDLGIPACGWATGEDVRVAPSSSYARVVSRALTRLDMVFYQSQELRERAASLLGIDSDQMSPARHMVLPRGIPAPPSLPREQIRKHIRAQFEINDDDVLVFSSARFLKAKGISELSRALSIALTSNPRIRCLLVGSSPAFDDSLALCQELNRAPLRNRVRVLPACPPEEIWEYLCAADLFAFTSHQEGMPNGLLEAMAMGIPSIAFAIPPVLELEVGTGALVPVTPFDPALFAEAILRLASSREERVRIGERARSLVLDRYMVKTNMAVALDSLTRLRNKTTNPTTRGSTSTLIGSEPTQDTENSKPGCPHLIHHS